jgi:hypothetical protein
MAGRRGKCSRQCYLDEIRSGRKYQQVQDRETQENIYMSKMEEENRK